MQFFLEVLIGGLLAGVMYSLVALGFVLIYKASGVFNFAQGSMVLFAALTFVSLVERGLGSLASFAITLAVVTERFVLRPLVNQPPISLFMATIGLAFFLEGLGPFLWGNESHEIRLGIPDEPLPYFLDRYNIAISTFDLAAAVIAGILVASRAE